MEECCGGGGRVERVAAVDLLPEVNKRLTHAKSLQRHGKCKPSRDMPHKSISASSGDGQTSKALVVSGWWMGWMVRLEAKFKKRGSLLYSQCFGLVRARQDAALTLHQLSEAGRQ